MDVKKLGRAASIVALCIAIGASQYDVWGLRLGIPVGLALAGGMVLLSQALWARPAVGQDALERQARKRISTSGKLFLAAVAALLAAMGTSWTRAFNVLIAVGYLGPVLALFSWWASREVRRSLADAQSAWTALMAGRASKAWREALAAECKAEHEAIVLQSRLAWMGGLALFGALSYEREAYAPLLALGCSAGVGLRAAVDYWRFESLKGAWIFSAGGRWTRSVCAGLGLMFLAMWIWLFVFAAMYWSPSEGGWRWLWIFGWLCAVFAWMGFGESRAGSLEFAVSVESQGVSDGVSSEPERVESSSAMLGGEPRASARRVLGSSAIAKKGLRRGGAKRLP